MAIVPVDLDSDGDQDVAFGSYLDDKVVWHENDGSGLFGPERMIIANGGWPSAIRSVDLNGDTEFDLLCGYLTGDRVAWHQNLGNGVFATPQHTIASSEDSVLDVAFADIDNDGDADVVSASGSSDRVALYIQASPGVFGTQVIIEAGVQGARNVSLGDIDGDGDIDILASYMDALSASNHMIMWYANDGQGAFSPRIPISSSVRAWEICLSDIDGNGSLDVAAASGVDDTVSWFPNNGLGTFGPRQVITNNADGAWWVGARDIDQDGDQDIIAISQLDRKLALHENLGGGSFSPEAVIAITPSQPRTAAFGDLNGDGLDDILVGSTFSASYYPRLNPPVQADASSYGVGCGLPPLSLLPNTAPVIGLTGSASITNAPTQLGGVTLGFSKTHAAGLPILPLSLAAVGMPGCNLWHSNDIRGLPVSSATPGVLHFGLQIPTAPTIVGQIIYLQAYCYDPLASPRKFIASNGLEWLIGNF
jgi:hypothetical protein